MLKRKVLIYGLNYYPELTGVGKYTGELADWLSSHGCQVNVITAPPYYPDWKVKQGYTSLRYQAEMLDGVQVYRCPIYVPGKPTGLKRITHLLSFAISSLPVALAHVFWKPDVVIVIEPTFLIVPASRLLQILTRSKSWLHIQDFEIDAAFNLGILKNGALKSLMLRLEASFMSKYDRVSTISYKMLDRLDQKMVPLASKYYFPNWVDCEKIFPLKQKTRFYFDKLGLSDDVKIALYSGNLGEKQGLEILVDIASRLASDENIHVVICGNGPALNKIIALSDSLKNIHFLPLQPFDKLNELLSFADVHLMPQKSGVADLVMPSKLTGMLASGKPIVAMSEPDSQIGQVVEQCGFVVGYDDIDGFTNALLRLFYDSKLSGKLGKNARQYALTYLSKDAVLSKFNDELNILCRVS